MFNSLGISLLVLGLLLFASGCSNDEKTASIQQLVRGEPIRGEPIRPPDVSSTTTVVTAKNIQPMTSNIVAKTDVEMKACDAPLPKRFAEKPAPKPEFEQVGFDKLASYTFNVPDGVIPTNQIGKSEEQIPKEIKAFDQQKVALKGFMLPLKVDNGLVTEMLIMKDQSMCCYGAIPRINDWVSVKMKGGVKSIMDQPVTLYGKLRVGEMVENGYLIGIYEMAGEKMDEPK
jgi:hypothetical protein